LFIVFGLTYRWLYQSFPRYPGYSENRLLYKFFPPLESKNKKIKIINSDLFLSTHKLNTLSGNYDYTENQIVSKNVILST